MNPMTAHPPSVFRSILACLLVGAATPAWAVGLGELQVHSALGEPLDATVALSSAPGAIPRADCFALGRAGAGGLPGVPRATFSVEPDGSGWRVRIRTRAALAEPVLQLRLDASCEGRDAASRNYEILLDPRPARTPPPAFRSLPGDTLAALAAAIYPNSPAVREAYVRALVAANPAVAGLPPDQPVPPGTPIVLPDLRRFSMSLATTPAAARSALPAPAAQGAARPAAQAAPQESAAAAKPTRVATGPRKAEVPKSAPVAKPEVSRSPPVAKPEAPKPAPGAKPAEARKPPSPATAPARPGDGRFVLRLSSSEVDLTRSRGIDDGTRSRLRERLLVLDADDQVAALLSMRNSLKQLEGRVAELQLKLSMLPATVTATPAKPQPAPAAAPPPVKPQPVPTAAPPPAAPAQVATPNAQTATTAQPKPDVAAAAGTTIPTRELSAPARPAPAAALVSKPPAPVAPADAEKLPSWLWGVLALIVAVIAALAWRMRRPRARARGEDDLPASPSPASDLDDADAMMRRADAILDEKPPVDAAREHRFVAGSDESLATEVPAGDPEILRRRYIEERFPEIATGTIEPGNEDSVVKAARLFYEDGAIARAIELLHFAVEEQPAALKPWLALFEIFRLERLAGPFADLAARFREHHGSSRSWLKVQHIGREIDPKNPLFGEPAFNSIETIAIPAQKAGEAVTFDPLAENWLNAPMDFTTDALAASLRSGLLADAGVTDSDLIANPMPALKSVEMFNVA